MDKQQEAPRRTYTQNEAAEVLGVHRNTLMSWRKAGKMRTDVVVSEPAADLGIPQNTVVLYDADLVDAIAAGKERLAKEPEPVA